MDQGPPHDVRPRGWNRTDVLELVRAVGLRLAITGVVAVAVATVHRMAFDGSFDAAMTTVLLVAAGALPMLEMRTRVHDGQLGLGGSMTSQSNPAPRGDSALTPVGILLFVSLPLVVVATFVGA